MKFELVIYRYVKFIVEKNSFLFYRLSKPFLCDPLINHKHPFSSVASSVGIQNPVIVIGSVCKNVASWCGVTSEINDRNLISLYFILFRDILCCYQTSGSNFLIFINEHRLRYGGFYESDFSRNIFYAFIKCVLFKYWMKYVQCVTNLRYVKNVWHVNYWCCLCQPVPTNVALSLN